jgi:glutamate carboxypeptidase
MSTPLPLPIPTDLTRALDARVSEILPRLRTWCALNSHTANLAGVDAMGAALRSALELPGLRCERRAGNGVGEHLCWRTPAFDDAGSFGQRVLLVGHHDTVFPPGTFEAFELDLTADRLRAPGALDMKGGLAVVAAVLAALADVDDLAGRPVALVSVADEETSSLDSGPWLRALGAGVKAALVFESGRAGDAIITRRKGTGRLVLSVTGRAAHAGNDLAAGINAIVALARLVERVADLDLLKDPACGVTLNVGTIRGGESVNTVPAFAEAVCDFRVERAADAVHLSEAVRAIAADIATRTGATITVGGGLRRPPLERTPASAALLETYAACARAAGLGASEAGLLGGGSDANTLSAVGVPAIDGLGPRGKGFHTHEEFIEPSSLGPKAEALLRCLLALTTPTT